MKRFGLLLACICCFSISVFSQGAKNIKINEVLTNNTNNLQDEFGHHLPWIELANVAYSSYNVRGMYVTTDTTVLNKEVTAPERIKRMSIIPSHDECTELSARQHLVLYLNSNPAKGVRHLSTRVDSTQTIWIALYDGNGVDLIDSVTVPVLAANTSYARRGDGEKVWVAKAPDAVTPGTDNFIQVTESKVAKLKREDPYGFGITVLSMGIVFSCLALLYVFFTFFGRYMKRMQEKKNAEEKEKRKARHASMSKAASEKEMEQEICIAVISMAIKQYQDDVHDQESGVITILPKHTDWK